MNNFGHIYSLLRQCCAEVITYMDLTDDALENEEREMYMKTLKKVLSGALGEIY